MFIVFRAGIVCLLIGGLESTIILGHPKHPVFCLKGKVLPQLFIYGAQRAVTTSIAKGLMQNPRIIFPTRDGGAISSEGKELRFFSNSTRFAKGQDFLGAHFPDCPSSYVVSVDATPQLHNEDVPSRISNIYGGLAKRLKFVVTLREPVQRSYSAYTYGLQKGWGNLAQTPTIREWVKRYLPECSSKGHLLQTPDGDGWVFWDSNYAKQLKKLLEYFRPKQLMVATMKNVLKPPAKYPTFVEYISAWVRAPVPTGFLRGPTGIADVRRVDEDNLHAKLEEALSKDERQCFKQALYNVTGPTEVAKVLGGGVNLYAFDDEDDVKKRAAWLRTTW